MLLFVQANVVRIPVFAVKEAGLIEVVGQTLISDCVVRTGVGFIVTVNVTGALVHPFAVAVTEMVPLILKLVRFAGAAYEVISPDPVAANPIAILLLVQLNMAPATLLEKVPGFIVLVGQTIISDIADTTGVGLIVIEKFMGVLTQLLRVAVTAIFPTNADPVKFTGAIYEAIFPVPEAPKPIVILLFVHE
jgi:hypothetical protein